MTLSIDYVEDSAEFIADCTEYDTSVAPGYHVGDGLRERFRGHGFGSAAPERADLLIRVQAEPEQRAGLRRRPTSFRQPHDVDGALGDAGLLSRALDVNRVRRLQTLAGNRSVTRLLRAGAGQPDEAAAATDAGQAADAAVEALDLSTTAKAAATQLHKAHPDIVFTSGRRDVSEQAHAMASNIVSSSNRNWIKDTYKSAAPLQAWIDSNPKKTSVAEIAEGLQGVLDAMSDEDKGKVSKHLSGDAFDVQPQAKDAATIKDDIKKLPGLSKFLDHEGGLERWHAQF